MGFIGKFLLPREVDFNVALLSQAEAGRMLVDDLYKACIDNDGSTLSTISAGAKRARELKKRNMSQLLDVFITPYDKESIYRMITQLDWIVLSVKHFWIERRVYEIHSLAEYQPIFHVLLDMATSLEDGISSLSTKRPKTIADKIEHIHDQYDQVVELCAKETANLLSGDDCIRIFRHKDMLLQLKEIAKRIHITANTLEDMALKIV